MKHKYRNYRNKKSIPTKYKLLVLSGICIISIFVSLTLNISGGPLNTAAGYVFVPMQGGINSIGLWIKDKTKNFKTLEDVLAENSDLKKQVDDLTVQLNTVKLEQYEYDNYRELLELDEKYSDYDKVAASVIAKDAGNWFSTFTIDRGSNDGLAVGMNVIAGSGLVGIITDVGPNFSKVRSIIDDASNVSSMVTTTKDNFNISGDLKSMNEDKVITYAQLKDDNDKVAIGDPVVTSYVSDQYQPGILIGYIATVEKNPNNLTKAGTITPIVDFEHLENVLVITEIKHTGDETLDNTESTENTNE